MCARVVHNNASTGNEHLSKRWHHQVVAVVRVEEQNGAVELQHAVDRGVLRREGGTHVLAHAPLHNATHRDRAAV